MLKERIRTCFVNLPRIPVVTVNAVINLYVGAKQETELILGGVK